MERKIKRDMGLGASIAIEEIINTLPESRDEYVKRQEKMDARFATFVSHHCLSFLASNDEMHIRREVASNRIAKINRHTIKPRKKEDLIDLKMAIDQTILNKALAELLPAIIFRGRKDIQRLGLSINKGNVFLWIQINDEKLDLADFIDNAVLQFNAKWNKVGVQISCSVHEKFMNILPPDNYELYDIVG